MGTTAWEGCYDAGWGDLIVPTAYAHPAKIARGLAERIYGHAFSEGWLRAGMVVVDPFGGIGGVALYAATRGVRWVGCELEPKFHSLALENFELWRREFGHWREWVKPEMVCGDSRRLCELVGGAGVVVSSPPYATGDSASAQSIVDRYDKSAQWVKNNCGSAATHGYGTTAGQLGAMREGDVQAVVSSPPFESCLPGGEGPVGRDYVNVDNRKRLPDGTWPRQREDDFYNNLGAASGDTFWAAARIIVEQCHRLLSPGGHAVWVVKNYVKGGKIVPFTENWKKLCEAVGFSTVCEHRAMLVKDLGVQTSLFDPPERKRRERKSFFRRLAEKKGAPPIDWESVICQEKR